MSKKLKALWLIPIFILLTIILFVFPKFLLAGSYEYEIYCFDRDLDNDGHKETIKAFQRYDRSREEPIPDSRKSYEPDLTQKGWKKVTEILPFTKPNWEKYPTPIEVVVTVFNPVTKTTDSFSLPDRLVNHGIKLCTLNNDGYRQLQLLTDKEEKGYFNYAIYGYKDGKLYKIFERLNSKLCEYRPTCSGQTVPPNISFSKTTDCGNGSMDYRMGWEVWVWDGEKFIETDGKSFWGRDKKGVSKILKWDSNLPKEESKIELDGNLTKQEPKRYKYSDYVKDFTGDDNE